MVLRNTPSPPRSHSPQLLLRTPRRRTARIALQTRAVAHQREIPALAAHFAFVAFGLGFGAAFGGRRLGIGAGVEAVLERAMFERLRRRELLLGLGLECGGAGEFAARAGAGKRGHVRGRSG